MRLTSAHNIPFLGLSGVNPGQYNTTYRITTCWNKGITPKLGKRPGFTQPDDKSIFRLVVFCTHLLRLLLHRYQIFYTLQAVGRNTATFFSDCHINPMTCWVRDLRVVID